DEGRRDHAAERGCDRQACASDIGELSFVDLAADLHPDDEEEDGHQSIVHPEVERLNRNERTDAYRYRRVPQALIRRRPRRICPYERDEGRDEEHDAARGLDVQKSLDRAENTLSDAASGSPGL